MAVVEFPVQGGGWVAVSVAAEDGEGVVSRGLNVAGVVERAEQSFESALATIRVVAEGVLAQLSEVAQCPEEVQVEFGLELTAKAGAMLATAGSNAQLRVALTWKPAAASSNA